MLDQTFIADTKLKVEETIIPKMERIYLHNSREDYGMRESKEAEKIVGYYDYQPTGISVMAKLAQDGHPRSTALIDKINDNIDYYRENIWGHDIGGLKPWNVPLRRLLFHLAIAYERLKPVIDEHQRQRYILLANEQVPLAIKHCNNFYENEKRVYLKAGNHDAIFMQGVYHCGRVFGRPDWQNLARDFAERFYESGHPDGYFEEYTNEAREGGPSLNYTRLTAGCLYDVLDGKNNPREKFFKAGKFARSFCNRDFQHIPLADGRTNSGLKPDSYGLALHSLTDEGRFFIRSVLEQTDYENWHPEQLAVLYHELDLMVQGDCKISENLQDGTSNLTLPLGVVRKNGFTAAVSALRADIAPKCDYALELQNLAYLSYKGKIILPGTKSKGNPEFSTFRIGDDAYPVRTGTLKMGDGRAEATAHYETFNATIRWDIGDSAKLSLKTDSDLTITTCLPVAEGIDCRTESKYEIRELQGFSPYTAGNRTRGSKALVFKWNKSLTIEFPGSTFQTPE